MEALNLDPLAAILQRRLGARPTEKVDIEVRDFQFTAKRRKVDQQRKGRMEGMIAQMMRNGAGSSTEKKKKKKNVSVRYQRWDHNASKFKTVHSAN